MEDCSEIDQFGKIRLRVRNKVLTNDKNCTLALLKLFSIGIIVATYDKPIYLEASMFHIRIVIHS